MCTAAKQHLYSIISSALASNVAGMSRPSARAVLRLMTGWNLVGGLKDPAGFSPFFDCADRLLARCVQVATKGLRGMDVRRGPMHNDRGLHGLAVTRS